MVRLKALGQSSIEVGKVRIGPEQPYLFAIALYLIVERGKKIPRQALVELIWPKVKDERHARQRFRQALLRLRESGLPIVGGNGTLLLDKHSAEADFDLLSSPENIRPGQSFEFLPHYAPRISERFLDWVDTQRSRVHAGVQRVFLIRMQQARNRGDWGEVDALATECLRLNAYNEEAVMAHAECAVMRGSKREALTILDTYMEALGSQVGTIGLPAKILRTRIAERLTDQRYAMISEQHFVGRESSMKMLLELLHHAKHKAGSAAFIWGEPGIGKSRLVQELTQVASMEGARVVSTKCQPTDVGRPLSAFADLVPMLKTLPGALGCSAQTLSLLQRLTDRNRNDTLPMQEAGDAAFLAATIRRAVFDLVDAVADEGLLVMVIEDVHWLDEPSWTIVSAMVEWSTTRKLLILMTSRTAHATERKVTDPDRGLHRHRLPPLADSDSGTLLDKLTAATEKALTEEVRTWAVSAAEGNPYYLRELVRHWVETQQSFGVPKSLAELIEARLNRLSSLGLRTLQLCAAFGKHSSFERLENATGYQNHVLLDAIEELSNAVMLSADNAGVVVKHDLLATAVLNRLAPAAARLVHRQVATVLEAEISEKHTASLMWDCAEHWQRAGETAHALATVRLCARHLLSVGQVHQSIELYEKALPICVTAEDRLETILGLASGLKAAGKWERLKQLLTAALSVPIHSATSDRDRLDLLLIETDWRLRSDMQTSALQSLVAFAANVSKDASLRLQAAQLGMILCSEEGRSDVAHFLATVVGKLDVSGDDVGAAAHIRMIYHSDFGDLSLSLPNAKEFLAFEIKRGDPCALNRSRLNVAVAYRRSGLLDEARGLLKENVAFAQEHALDAQGAVAMTWLALFSLSEEDFAAADEWRARASHHACALEDRRTANVVKHIEARVGLERGDVRAAREYLARFPADLRNFTNYRVRQAVAAIRTQLAVSTGENVDRELLETMATDFEKFCDQGQHDYFALALYKALGASGESARGQRILTDYVLHRRRDRGPLPPSLAEAMQSVRAT